jgi:hypothetical protein
MPDPEDDSIHVTTFGVDLVLPSGMIPQAADLFGMWLLDVCVSQGIKARSGVRVELHDDDLVVPLPAGWVSFRLVVDVDEKFDVDV